MVAAALQASVAAGAQQAARITQTVDPTQTSVLKNHHPQWANKANDTGSMPPSQQMGAMTLVLARSAEKEGEFRALVDSQQNPSSPNYHRWLSPAEVGERFGLSDQDIAAITGWLESEGLHVTWISPSRIFVGFGGTAADVDRAFQTELHTYNVNGSERMSVASDPHIPSALEPAIRAVHGLYTIKNHPAHYLQTFESDSPQLTTSNGSHFIAPGDFSQIYDLPNEGNSAGKGQTIAILGRSRTDFADFENFQSLTGVSFSDPTEIIPTSFGGVDPGPALTSPPSGSVDFADQSEATLDV